jgi:hypothetical protein
MRNYSTCFYHDTVKKAGRKDLLELFLPNYEQLNLERSTYFPEEGVQALLVRPTRVTPTELCGLCPETHAHRGSLWTCSGLVAKSLLYHPSLNFRQQSIKTSSEE